MLTRLRAGSFGIACQNLLPSACTPSQSWNVPSPSTESQAGKRLSRSADAIQVWSISWVTFMKRFLDKVLKIIGCEVS